MRKLHFIGIGGAGMAPLAAIMLQRGAAVSGSDRERNAKTDRLAAAGATIHIGHRAEQLPPDAELVVYSSAVASDNPERREALRRGIPELRRGEFLARLAASYRRTAAVSGSHGKTSVTAMLVHILTRCGRRPGFLIGAAMQDGSPGADAGRGDDLFITEVDESDGTHTLIHPELGIVPNVDDDHSWSVGGEEALHRNFRTFAENCRRLESLGKDSCEEPGNPSEVAKYQNYDSQHVYHCHNRNQYICYLRHLLDTAKADNSGHHDQHCKGHPVQCRIGRKGRSCHHTSDGSHCGNGVEALRREAEERVNDVEHAQGYARPGRVL